MGKRIATGQKCEGETGKSLRDEMQDSLSPNNEKCHMILKMSYWTATASVVEGCYRILKEIIAVSEGFSLNPLI